MFMVMTAACQHALGARNRPVLLASQRAIVGVHDAREAAVAHPEPSQQPVERVRRGQLLQRHVQPSPPKARAVLLHERRAFIRRPNIRLCNGRRGCAQTARDAAKIVDDERTGEERVDGRQQAQFAMSF